MLNISYLLLCTDSKAKDIARVILSLLYVYMSIPGVPVGSYDTSECVLESHAHRCQVSRRPPRRGGPIGMLPMSSRMRGSQAPPASQRTSPHVSRRLHH